MPAPLRALYDVPAPAKINLFLHVVGRRSDGYHLLQSPFVLVDWADRLHFERRADGRLQRQDLGPALPADDLSLRAARALQAASGCGWGVDIQVDKQVPWGAGLGGGSSDAASTLLALNRLWGLHWPRERLAAIGLQLGADVPFFIGGDNAFVEGIGERLTPIALPAQRYAIVKPRASLPTPDIFAHPALVRDTEPVILMGCSDTAWEDDGSQAHADGERQRTAAPSGSAGKDRRGWQAAHDGFGRNDLQEPAVSLCPEVGAVLDWLRARFGNSRMTGSGSAVFARLNDEERLEVGSVVPSTATCLADMPPGWVGRICCSLGQHPLRGWAG